MLQYFLSYKLRDFFIIIIIIYFFLRKIEVTEAPPLVENVLNDVFSLKKIITSLMGDVIINVNRMTGQLLGDLSISVTFKKLPQEL